MESLKFNIFLLFSDERDTEFQQAARKEIAQTRGMALPDFLPFQVTYCVYVCVCVRSILA